LRTPQTNLEQLLSLIQTEFGEIDFISPDIAFDYSSYYTPEMGPGLIKSFISLKNLIPAADISNLKIHSNKLEDSLTKNNQRTVNLDPGLFSHHNLLLLTTKNFAHRIPLQTGIYAEVTLIWRNNNFTDLPWTYPDFKTPEYKTILKSIRSIYTKQIQNEHSI
jgi:hypothetical protein